MTVSNWIVQSSQPSDCMLHPFLSEDLFDLSANVFPVITDYHNCAFRAVLQNATSLRRDFTRISCAVVCNYFPLSPLQYDVSQKREITLLF